METPIQHSATLNPQIPGRISVLIPVFNEGKRIKRLLTDIHNQFNGYRFKNYEVIVIDDGSIDNTKIFPYERVKYIKIERNSGKGMALKVGFEYATGDYIFFLDGDYQIHPKHIWKYLEVIEKSKADVVIASKRHCQSNIEYPPLRKFISNGYHLLVLGMFGLKLSDTQTGFKVFRSHVLKRIFPIVTSKLYAFDFEILLLAHKMNYKIVERPVEIMDVGKYKRFSFWDIYHTFKDTVSIWYRYYIKRSYVFYSYYSEGTEQEPRRMSACVPTSPFGA